jgi:hypothetical protein
MINEYGRCLSKQEAKDLRKNGQLNDSDNSLIPIFNAPEYIQKKLNGMKRDQLKNYFRRIGVRQADTVIFFGMEPNLIEVGPVPQKNGLNEYKVPSGTPVSTLYQIKL